jgi:hypothetical protein
MRVRAVYVNQGPADLQKRNRHRERGHPRVVAVLQDMPLVCKLRPFRAHGT